MHLDERQQDLFTKARLGQLNDLLGCQGLCRGGGREQREQHGKGCATHQDPPGMRLGCNGSAVGNGPQSLSLSH
jgi:hypothetical protein